MTVPDSAKVQSWRLLKPACWVAGLLSVTLGEALYVNSFDVSILIRDETEPIRHAERGPFNGFDLTRATVPTTLILSGGPNGVWALL